MPSYNGGRDEYVTLDGYQVMAETNRAIGIAKAGLTEELVWLPRSQCDDGDHLSKGDTDISVKSWLAEKEGLDG